MYQAIIIVVLSIICCDGLNIKGFDDSILFNINWPGTKDTLDLSGERIVVTSSLQEQYECFLPKIQEKESNSEETYEGGTALALISSLFHPKLPCSYRLETYWTYEVCHGRYIRQYHEDREGKTVKLQEYTLGKWESEKLVDEFIESSKNKVIPTKKIDGNNLPYLEIVMGNGTVCDLNQKKPRQTSVIYVCYIHGVNEIYSLKETSTCQYEIVILTPLLCAHPKYKPAETGENKINCLPLGKANKKPYDMVKMQLESKKQKKNAGMDQIRVEFLPLDMNENLESKLQAESPIDSSPVESFLSGKNCLNGGTGWWKYEFCYGKSVVQYHYDNDAGKGKISINLGVFNKANHLKWIEKNPHKRPKPLSQRIQLSHFYSGGSICDKTGKARQTEVKLKCKENASLNTVSLYLLEPRYCEYILGVESPLICDILKRADENGLVENEESAHEDVTYIEL